MTPAEKAVIEAAQRKVIVAAWAAADHPDHSVARERLRAAVAEHRQVLGEVNVA